MCSSSLNFVFHMPVVDTRSPSYSDLYSVMGFALSVTACSMYIETEMF